MIVSGVPKCNAQFVRGHRPLGANSDERSREGASGILGYGKSMSLTCAWSVQREELHHLKHVPLLPQLQLRRWLSSQADLPSAQSMQRNNHSSRATFCSNVRNMSESIENT